jgi:TM2 domain-containing membrane protein YozV
MQATDPIYTANMTDHQRNWFYAEYNHASHDEAIGVLLAIFLGCFGIHHFYLRRNGLGILYLLLFWTGISAVLGLIDAFFTPGRVRRYNAEQASHIAIQILGSTTGHTTPRCPACGKAVESTAIFCPNCGATTTPSDTFNIQPA